MWRILVSIMLLVVVIALTPSQSYSWQTTETPEVTPTATPGPTITPTSTPWPTPLPTPTPSLTFTPGPSPTLSTTREVISAETVARLSLQVPLESGNVRDIAFSPDSQQVITAGQDGVIRLFDIYSGAQIAEFVGHVLPVEQVDYIDSTTIISMGLDKTVRLWNVESPEEAMTIFSASTRIFQIDFHDDWLAMALADGTVQIWSLESQSEIVTLKTNVEAVHSVAFNEDGTKLAGGTSRASVYTWDTVTWEEIRVTPTETNWVSGVLWVGRDSFVASGYITHLGDLPDAIFYEFADPLQLLAELEILIIQLESSTRMWQFGTGETIWRENVSGVVPVVVISPDRTLLAQPGRHETVEIWGIKP